MLRKLIKKSFEFLGYKLIKTETTLLNAHEYNAQEQSNVFYESDKKIKSYYNKQRLDSFNEIYTFIDTKVNKAGIDVLDAGCGAGFFTDFLYQKLNQAKITGVDFSDTAICYSKNKYTSAINFYVKNLSEKINDQFDLICCISVLEHLQEPDIVLKNLLSALKENGKLIIVIPNGRIDTYEGHIHFWSLESWELFLNKYAKNYNCKSYMLQSKSDILSVVQS